MYELKSVNCPEDIASEDWNDWRWQIKNSITQIEELQEYIELDQKTIEEIEKTETDYRWKITPYFARLMAKKDENCPVRKQVIPDVRELKDPVGVIDPLDEEKHEPAPGIIRVYPDRIAWCVSNQCAALCRHCLRKRFMTAGEEGDFSRKIEWRTDLLAPLPENTVVGKIEFFKKEAKLGEANIITAEEIPRGGFRRLLGEVSGIFLRNLFRISAG